MRNYLPKIRLSQIYVNEFQSAKPLSKMESIRNENAIVTKLLKYFSCFCTHINHKDILQSDASILKHNANFEYVRECRMVKTKTNVMDKTKWRGEKKASPKNVFVRDGNKRLSFEFGNHARDSSAALK